MGIVLKKLDDYRFLIPRGFREGMRIEGLVFADDQLIRQIEKDQTLDQVANVATLPGLVGRSLAMPDAHQGYGFCIGGVAAADAREGVVSAGGVGFDINCGVRLLSSPLSVREVRPHLSKLLAQQFRDIPCGTGRSGLLKISRDDLDQLLRDGARWAVGKGYGTDADLSRIEDFGCLKTANPVRVSDRAKERGHSQLGTLGSGNHFLEIQVVDEIFDAEVAERFGLDREQIVVLIHSGSRGLGHQVCTDYLDLMLGALRKYDIDVVDRQLACVPIQSQEGQDYLSAMAAAANFAFVNRQMITHWTRKAFERIVGTDRLNVVYDVCHNIAKFEEHMIQGRSQRVLVHRKGATRAFPPGHPALPEELRPVGQPVLIPGSMGTCSYVLVGTEAAMNETFGSSCHGAGRSMSRSQAKRETTPEQLLKEMKEKGILVKGQTRSGLTEEKPNAYKDVGQVVAVVHNSGLARKVARLLPLAVMKG
jgi:tRNA-splicing ligase RtcB (3'-phosphate/5'-hydroxy nucleic acid ligase)